MKKITSKTSNSDVISSMVYGFTNPMDSRPQRFRDKFTSRPTCVAKPFTRDNAVWGDETATTSLTLAPELFFCAVFRDIFRASVQYEANNENSLWRYDLWGTDGVGTTASWNGLSIWGDPDLEIVPANWTKAVAAFGTVYRPHGNTLYPGLHEDECYIWIDAGVSDAPGPYTRLGIDIDAAASANNEIILEALKWDNGVVRFAGSAGVITGASSFYLPMNVADGYQSGYYTFRFKRASGTSKKVSHVYLQSTMSSFGHHCAGTLDQCVAAIGNYRVLSASLMYTNTASPLNKQGQITAVQFGNGQTWNEFVQTGFDAISEANGAATIPIDKGMYAFLKPTGPSDFDMQTGSYNNNGIPMRTGFQLGSNKEFVVMMGQCTAPDSRNGYVTVCHHVEFETTDNWRAQSKTNVDPVAFDDALLILASLPQFSENANHLLAFAEKVRGMLQKGLKAVEVNVPKLLEWSFDHLPQIASAAGAAAALL